MKKEDFIEDLNELRKNGAFEEMQNEWLDAIDKAIIYIEELENRLKEKENIVKKSSLEAQKYFDMLMEVEYGRDTIPKQKIRDKIEDLKEYQKQVESKVKEKYSERDTLLQVIGGIYYLKELLEEEK